MLLKFTTKFILLMFVLVGMQEPLLSQNPEEFSKVIFSHKAGFYDQVFSLTLSTPDQKYDILYTIDGSNPQNSSTVKNGGKSTSININPTSGTGRPRTPCYLVRASLKKPGETTLLPTSRTFIFLPEVVNQKAPGGGWPTSNVNGQIIDMEMDAKVTNSSAYQWQMEDALKAIPSISIVSDIDGLFGSAKGIYVNADRHGEEWERFCSVELIDPKQENEFNVNAGLRIRGGWSRHDNYPKHAFRLFFNANYGYSKLNFPLFDDEGVDQFDKIDLRTAENYGWNNGQDHNTFVREVFSRDSQRDMGQPYTRSRYYHLYLNGMYWGLYQTQERSEARYAADYFGGSDEDYDVVKVNTEDFNYRVEATDGNLDSWETVWNYCKTDLGNDRFYFELEGKNSSGKVAPGKQKWVDIDNLIDYMMTIFYTGNFDAPTTAFGGNQGPNNFYAINKRDDKTKCFVFFAHDAEHSMMIDPISPGIGIQENRVEISNMRVNGFSAFHPQWLHEKLTANVEYRQRFADRAYMHLFNDGVFTSENAEARFVKRAKEIDVAIIAESARWGDTFRDVAHTRDDDWLPEIDNMKYYFFPYRTDIVIDQLIEANLLTYLVPPKFTVDGKTLFTRKKQFDNTTKVVISSTNTKGDIYMTTDGTDPREIGGKVSSTAHLVENGKEFNLIETAWFKTRVKNGNEWSPLREVKFVLGWENYFNLTATELNYHPLDSIIGGDTVSESKFEFIEIKNIGSHPVELSRLKFNSAIEFHFGPKEMLAPGKFYVIAASSKWFFERYGKLPSDVYKKSFSNSGELVSIISDNNREVISFQYSDQPPWPSEADGEGGSLTCKSVYPLDDPNNADYWKNATFVHGSPFYDDMGWKLDVEEAIDLDQVVKVFPNPTADFLFVKLTDEKALLLELYTISGRLIHQQRLFQDTMFDLNELNVKPGLLLIKLSENGSSMVKKIVYQP
ncbi:MAG: CotH kinase family protein [Prolixibacteraceae bacterium]